MKQRDIVAAEDSINRVLVYALNSGEQKGKVFGRLKAISANGDKILVENDAGVADVYDSSNLKPLRHLVFPSRIVHAQFVLEGQNILLLTADQTVYQVRLSDQAENANLQK